jgi:hypothetical protein
MVDSTPYFPAWRAFCAPLGVQSAGKAADSVGSLERLFGKFFAGVLNPARKGPGSRRRCFGRTDIFWAFLSQVLTRGSSCRMALLRLQAEAVARGRRRPDDSTSAYCQARAALSLAWLQRLFTVLGQWIEPRVKDQWLGRTVRLIDGTGFSMPDSPKNRAHWPYAGGQKPGCGFPVGKMVGLFCLHSGRLIAFAHDTWKAHDLTLARTLLRWLKAGEVLVADRAYCGWFFLARLRRARVDFVIRLHQFRTVRSRRLGSRQETWPRPQPPKGQSQGFWQRCPRELPVRLVRFAVQTRGFRVRHIIVATSLLDQTAFPDSAIAELYARRWQIELHYRQVKVCLALDVLRGLSPNLIERELWMHAIAYNLVRALMLEAALAHDAPLSRLSFKGTLDALHPWADLTCSRATRYRARRQLLARIASDRLAFRPNRQEPRAKKRRPKNYQFLTKPRSQMRVSPSRGL